MRCWRVAPAALASEHPLHQPQRSRLVKRVLVLNQFAAPRDHAGGTRHVDLFGRLRDWDPLIVASRRSHFTGYQVTTSDDRFKLVWVPPYKHAGYLRMIGWPIYAFRSAVLGVSRRSIDLVYASTPHLLAPVAGAIIATLRGVPLVVEVRDLWPETLVDAGALRRGALTHRTLVRIEKWIYHRAQQIVVVTPGWEDHFGALGIPAEKIHIISNGTEISEFEVSEDREALRTKYSISKFTAVYAGAHSPANAMNEVLDAAVANSDVNFILVGEGPDKTNLVQRVKHDGIDNVRFLEPMPKSELVGLLHACDVGIHSFKDLAVLNKGMSPNKVFDYLAAMLPIVSNAEVGLRVIAIDGECGFFGKPGSLPQGVARAKLADAHTLKQMGERGRGIVERRFSRTAAARQLETLLDAMVEQGHSSTTLKGRNDASH